MIITITGYKGGIGKTTTAVHLTAFLHRHAGSTVLVDGDINRSATSGSPDMKVCIAGIDAPE